MNQRSKSIAVIFNTNQLGGGERSLIEQLSLVRDQQQFTFLLPNLKSDSAVLLKFLRDKGFSQTEFYQYPAFYYQLSRKDYHKLPLIVILLPYLVLSLFSWHFKFRKFSIFYINGNKAAFPVFVWLTLFNQKKNVMWHFRDFPSPFAFKTISRLVDFFLKKKCQIKLIANSFAVQKELEKYFRNYDIETIYNLAGNLKQKISPKKIETIGVVSMLAPWKGIHEVVLMSSIYQKELKDLSIKKIIIFGDNIYQTKGDHLSYSSQLKRLCKKLNVDLIEWGGKKIPQTIFAEIDLLIHSSIKPEPFGRVIIEAQKSRIPVISTGIGGAAELLGQDMQGLRYFPHDYHNLFQKIKLAVSDPDLVERLTRNAYNNCQILESRVKNQVSTLF